MPRSEKRQCEWLPWCVGALRCYRVRGRRNDPGREKIAEGEVQRKRLVKEVVNQVNREGAAKDGAQELVVTEAAVPRVKSVRRNKDMI